MHRIRSHHKHNQTRGNRRAAASVHRAVGKGRSDAKLTLHASLCACCFLSIVPAGAVFRISFATFFFFFTHALLLCTPICWQIDTFSWLGKVIYWLALLTLAYVLPEAF